jgi:FtsH-binding integral membrane protein
MIQSHTMSHADVEAEQQRFITKVFGWMSFALAVTGGVALYVVSNGQLLEMIVYTNLFFGLIIAELAVVFLFRTIVNRVSATIAIAMFLFYAALNGLTFSVIFVIYTQASIASTFFITAGTFAAMSIYGYTTKRDLTKMGSLLMMGLIGIIIASVVNFFFRNPMLYWIITFAGIAVFVGLTAYDVQKIKNMNVIGNEGTEEDTKEAVVGALILYLDFINLFLMLLRLFGKRR